MRKALGRWSNTSGPTAFLPKTHFRTVRNFCAQFAILAPDVLALPSRSHNRAFFAVMCPADGCGISGLSTRNVYSRRDLPGAMSRRRFLRCEFVDHARKSLASALRRLTSIASETLRIAARTASSGPPAKSCNTTGATTNGISSTRSPLGCQFASCRTCSSVTSRRRSCGEPTQGRCGSDTGSRDTLPRPVFSSAARL
jgi:hypothetical protein